MNQTRKTPATIITGFLGAGKTSLVRHLIENANGRRLALIVNEFGDVGVDGEVLRACGSPACGDGDIIELANGCLCCTVADEFEPAIEALLARDPAPDHIVIETSGLALPKPLLRAFNWPAIRTRVTVDGVVAVIDGPAVAAGRFADDPRAVQARREADDKLDHDSPIAELFEDQTRCADLIVLNKTDLMDDASHDAVAAQIAARARAGVQTLAARHGRVDPRVALGLDAAAEGDFETRPSRHDGDDDHDHDEFESFAIDIGAVVRPDDLMARLAALIAEHDILRVKGFVEVVGKPMRLAVQGVGPRLERYFDRDWRPGERRDSRLVFIRARAQPGESGPGGSGPGGSDRAALAAALA